MDAETEVADTGTAGARPVAGRDGPEGGMLEAEAKPAKLNVALLDKERRVYLGMVEVDEAELGAQHLRQVTACDLPPGEYRWDDKQECFVPLPRVQRAMEVGRPTLEQALAFQLLAQWDRDAGAVADVALAWLDDMVQSVDFQGYRATPLVARYAVSRGIVFGRA